MAAWHFTLRRPIDRIRDPIAGEFFANETISRPGEALVREGIQNSLDAGLDGQVVKVRIFVSGALDAVSASDIAPFLEGAWPHLEAKGNGLKNIPQRDEDCPYLVYEDFGTSGLVGDEKRTIDPPEGTRNPFFFFVRAEGRSDKSQKDRGRWGVGKQVFQMASRINSTFAVTVRGSDDRKMFIGQAVLKTHSIDGQGFTPDGWFGLEPTGDLPVLPVEDRALIDKFSNLFRLHRGNEPGLSIIMPWRDLELTHLDVLEAVIRHYFHPIITGGLEVTVETPQDSTQLAATTIENAIPRLGASFEKEVAPLIELARWAHHCDIARAPILSAPARGVAPNWSKDQIPIQILQMLQAAYDKSEPFAVRVPMYVHSENGDATESHFNVFVKRDRRAADEKPVFIREGIMISDARAPRCGGVRSIVLIDDQPLATMLGDAENPSHTRWEAGSHFKGKYRHGRQSLDYVVRSVSEIVRILTEAEKKEDRLLLADLFSLPADEDEVEQLEPEPDPGPNPPPDPPIPPEPRMSLFRISRAKGGFTIGPGRIPLRNPADFEVMVAYDVRRGNPLRKYRPDDFKINESPIGLEAVGVTILSKGDNTIRARAEGPEFRVTVSGFDPNRDVYVKLTTGVQDADTEA